MELLDNLDAKRFSVISNSANYGKRYLEPPPANTRCWWCKDLLLTTTGAPLGCPCVSHSIKPVGKAAALGMRRSFHMKLRGLFCCFECVAAHAIHENRDSTTLSSQLNDIRLMRKHLTKVPLDAPLIPSPSWTLLKLFGGPLSREEYRRIKRSSTSATSKTEERVLVESPPIILLPQEERVLLRETSRQLSALRYMTVAPRRPESGKGTIPVPSDPNPPPHAWGKPSGKGGGAIPAYRVVSKRTTLVSSARLPPQRRRNNNKSSKGKEDSRKDFGGLIKKF